LYDADQNLLSYGAATAPGHINLSSTVTGGDLYLLRASGRTAVITLGVHDANATSSPLDVNHDGYITELDALRIINEMNRNGMRSLSSLAIDDAIRAYDVNRDGAISAPDVLRIINYLNDAVASRGNPAAPLTAMQPASQSMVSLSLASPVATAVPAAAPPAVDLIFAELGEEKPGPLVAAAPSGVAVEDIAFERPLDRRRFDSGVDDDDPPAA
jgi:hypothetical protein